MTTVSAQCREGPLSGIRVLDLSRVLAGPWAAQTLGDMGADVVKVERPGLGDDVRIFGPPFVKDRDGNDTSRSMMFQSANRNKRSITIDFVRPEGRDIIHKLVATADVLIENFKPGTLDRRGLGYADLARINPRLIYCSITGYGLDGPYADRGGYDPIVQAASGIMSVTGFPLDQPGGGPMKAGPSVVDITTGIYAALAILGAVYDRDLRGGSGRHLDISLFDTGAAITSEALLNFLSTGVSPGLVGTQGNGGVPGGGYWCADGYIMIAPGNERLWQAFCVALDLAHLIDDPRFRNNSSRVMNRRALLEIIEPAIRALPVADIHDRMSAAGVPSSPVNEMEDVLAHPQAQHRKLHVDVDHPVVGPVPVIHSPLHANRSMTVATVPPPEVGEHTREILSEIGIADEDYEKLLSERVI